MGGGIIQLVAIGQQDTYITGNPEFTYFAMVFKRHTNFSMESIQLAFDTKPTLDTGGTFVCTIGRHADLMKDIYLSYRLPDIYSDDVLQFQWIQNVANYMVLSYSINVDQQAIDTQWGEWMDIWNELTMPTAKRATYDRMTGNTEEFVSPKAFADVAIVKSNWLSYSYYPAATASSGPSIRGRRFYLPLNFWFCKTPALAFPLVALQYNVVTVSVTLRPVTELYQVFDRTIGRYVSPAYFMSRHFNESDPLSADVGIGRFLVPPSEAKTKPKSTSIDIDAYLEVNYIYLDTPEQYAVASQPQDFLIERVSRVDAGEFIGSATITLPVHNPVKELVWITRRSDIFKYNDWANFTNSVPYDGETGILKSGRILFNGTDRLSEKDADYFNLLQPYQHHTNSPRQGVYCYSFALFPEKPTPSGTANFSMINNVDLSLTFNPNLPTISTTESVTTSYGYNVIVYAISYNIFRVMSGAGGIVFAPQ